MVRRSLKTIRPGSERSRTTAGAYRIKGFGRDRQIRAQTGHRCGHLLWLRRPGHGSAARSTGEGTPGRKRTPHFLLVTTSLLRPLIRTPHFLWPQDEDGAVRFFHAPLPAGRSAISAPVKVSHEQGIISYLFDDGQKNEIAWKCLIGKTSVV